VDLPAHAYFFPVADNYLLVAHNLNWWSEWEKMSNCCQRRIQAPSATPDLIEPTGDSRYEAMEKMKYKERFPLFQGMAAAISLILFTLFVALGL